MLPSSCFFFFNDTATTEIYTLSLHDALPICLVENGVTHQYLPPRPPRVHSFVYACNSEETASFTSQLDLLRRLLNSGAPHSDEIVGACIRQAAPSHGEPAEFLALACRALAVELSADVARLNSILRTVSP